MTLKLFCIVLWTLIADFTNIIDPKTQNKLYDLQLNMSDYQDFRLLCPKTVRVNLDRPVYVIL